MSNLPVASNGIAPTMETPDNAPAPAFDLTKPNLSFYDVFQPNYFSMEFVENLLEEVDEKAMLLEVDSVQIEFVYDPEKGVDTGRWLPVMRFKSTDSGLVLNKSRSEVCMKETGSPRVSDWDQMNVIELDVGKLNGHYQLRLRRAELTETKKSRQTKKNDKDVDLEEFNRELGLID